MTIIVTGGAGFIGSNFIFHMLNKYPDYRIICLDCLTYAGNLSTLEPVMDNPNFRFVKESITDRDAVYKLFEEEHPDMVVNFAAESHVDRSIENPEVFLDTNIKGTAVLMDACRKYGIKRYHQVSTDEVYGDLPLDRPDLFFTEEIFRQAVALGHTEYDENHVTVFPVTTAEYGMSKAARPFNSRLDKSKLVEAGFTPLPDWKDALQRYLKEVLQ